MRLLLDTHVVLWVMRDADELGAQARELIAQADVVYVSAASLWEVAIKSALGKLPIDPVRLQQQLTLAGFESLSVTWSHAAAVHSLPHHHRDPFDRLLIAQAMTEPLHLLTRDAALQAYTPLVKLLPA
ncbi:MAG: type II toxin-antitoxin system VapC family toxin [Burkholderiales bacterium]|nr:type II toxin-antitoxin system VapC family toxin [Burkholderiales bacterium]